MSSWRQMAEQQVMFVLTDLDRVVCPVALRQDWLGPLPLPQRLLLRIAVREVEAWALADHDAMRKLIGSKGVNHHCPMICLTRSRLYSSWRR